MTEYTLDFAKLMYFYGDVKLPLINSVQLMAKVVRDQMNFLLLSLEEVVCRHRGKTISHGDVLYILKKNKVKLKRLLHCLHPPDLKAGENGRSELEDVYHFIEPRKRRKYFKMCLHYLASIEDCGELSSLLQNKKILDISVIKRKMRQQWRANMMSFSEQEEYEIFCKEIAGPLPHFKKWLLQDKVTDLGITGCALRIVEFLVRETIAEIIDMILLLKMSKLKKDPYLLRDYRVHLTQHEPQFKIDTASKEEIHVPYDLAINQLPKRKRTYRQEIKTVCGPMCIHVRVEEMKTKPSLPTGVANDAVSDVSDDTDGSSFSDFGTNPGNDSQAPEPFYEPISDASDQENNNNEKRVRSEVFTCDFPAEYYEFDSSTASNHLSISAKNEVEFLSSIEPSEIADAFGRFQEPSFKQRMFNKCVVRGRTKLICLLDSLSFDIL